MIMWSLTWIMARAITFNDPRRFGAMDLLDTATADQHKLLAVLGPEPLGNDFHEAHLVDSFRNKNSPVKSALLDQGIVAGLGNIYVCEALFRAAISPRRKAGSRFPRIASPPWCRSSAQVLEDAIRAGGSSLKDFRQADGELGYFQHSFDVYGREGDPCRRDGCGGQIRCGESPNPDAHLSTVRNAKDNLIRRVRVVRTRF